ncbi:gluconate 2-dehydrogenase subunit 3 family protein [Chitinophaga pendula]|uniref:gluconate 2-dehydrogenase subunit 3 family protein n=1 Tax=Chitinophaga TaxID=79328 RepID=UPI000BAEA2BD|nr:MULTISPECIES: gluconate 2-dehydrogenase subunit 3 family protein [Chitinophaga]ASZ10425.1 transcriptional initiation protein Tat [Chitinophaga sp. MD30]UCJ06607.1 gluconate 2-dehydrogenase subunit 3 family protein [Chitinophaga pendula]
MDRRESLKALAVGSLSVGAILTACNDKKDTGKKEENTAAGESYGRTIEEAERDASLHKEKFFTDAEMKTITVLANIIIPADDHSGSAQDAKVPEFIEFIVKDQPNYKLPMRGGLRWLDVQCLKDYSKGFTDCSKEQQIALVDKIAYPEKAPADMTQGVAFFNMMRNLTATGYFTSKTGIEYLGYKGNTPNEWDGVPDDVLKQYGLAYDEKTLAQSLNIKDRGTIMTWD